MREIKFRAVHKETGKVFNNVTFDSFDCGYLMHGSECFNTCELDFYPCIGLSDMNGAWIYESDIVRVSGDDDFKPFIYQVKCENAIAVVPVYDFDYDYTAMQWAQDVYPYYQYQVIGNIHENPELLGGEDE